MEKNKKHIYKKYVKLHIYSLLYIYIYLKLNHFASQQKLVQHCKTTILQLKKKKEKIECT